VALAYVPTKAWRTAPCNLAGGGGLSPDAALPTAKRAE